MTEETPVAWLYTRVGGNIQFSSVRMNEICGGNWIETPLYTRPSTPPAVSDDLVGAVEALGRARNLAMKNTVAARVPECGDFGAIAQDLDWLQNELPAIIQRREQQAAEAKLAELLEAWLHTTDDQDIAHYGITVLSAIRALPTQEAGSDTSYPNGNWTSQCTHDAS